MDLDYTTRDELADIVLNLISLNIDIVELRNSLRVILNQVHTMGYESGYRDGCNQ